MTPYNLNEGPVTIFLESAKFGSAGGSKMANVTLAVIPDTKMTLHLFVDLSQERWRRLNGLN